VRMENGIPRPFEGPGIFFRRRKEVARGRGERHRTGYTKFGYAPDQGKEVRSLRRPATVIATNAAGRPLSGNGREGAASRTSESQETCSGGMVIHRFFEGRKRGT